MDSREPSTGSLQVTGHTRADRDDSRVVALAQVRGREISADVDAVDEADPLLTEDVDAPVDDSLLEFRVWHPEPHQPAGALVALVDGDLVAAVVELSGNCKSGWPGPDHRDRSPRAAGWRFGDDPAFGKRPLGNRHLDLLDAHRVVVYREHACRLAGRRADATGEYGEVVGRVKLVDRLAPLVAVDEVVPLWD